MYRPFGWETVDLRYGGIEARLETMHHRLIRFLDHIEAGGEVGKPLGGQQGTGEVEQGVLLRPNGAEHLVYEEEVTSLPELEVELHVAYPSADQILDYHRVSRPTYC